MSTTTSYLPTVENIPRFLREQEIWVCFRITVQPDGSLKKEPIQPGVFDERGEPVHASNADPGHWTSFNDAYLEAGYNGYAVACVLSREGASSASMRTTVSMRRGRSGPTPWSAFGRSMPTARSASVRWGSTPWPSPCCRRTAPPRRYRRAVSRRSCTPSGATASSSSPATSSMTTAGSNPAQEIIDVLFPPRQRHANGSTESPGYAGAKGPLNEGELAGLLRTVQPYWVPGQKHLQDLAAAALMAKAGVKREQAVAIITELSKDDNDPGAKITACNDTYDRYEAGEEVMGYQGLVDVCGLSEEQATALAATLAAFRIRNAPPPPEPPPPRQPEFGKPLLRRQAVRVEDLPASGPFPLEILPPAMSLYVKEAAAAIPIAPEVIGGPVFGYAGSVIGDRRVLHLKRNWPEYSSTFWAIVARSGSAKTPGLAKALDPLKTLQRQAKKAHAAAMASYDDALEQWDASPRGSRGSAPTKPLERRYYTKDINLEKLSRLLARGPGLAISSDELAGWNERMDQYRKGGDRQHYMSMWSSDPLLIDRVNEESTVAIQHPVVCVVGSIPPEEVPTLLRGTSPGAGWVQRFIPIVPVPLPKIWNPDVDVSPGAEASIRDLFEALDALSYDLDEDGQQVPQAITLTPEASRVWGRWSDALNAQAVREGSLLGHLLLQAGGACRPLRLDPARPARSRGPHDPARSLDDGGGH